MTSKSAWASSVSFSATDKRTAVFDLKNIPEVCDGAYYPKTTIADHIPKEKKLGPFGSATQRFNFPESSHQGENAGRDDSFTYIGGSVNFGGIQERALKYEGKGKARIINCSLIGAAQPQSSFVKSNQERFVEKVQMMGPPPGTYDVAPKWDKSSVVPMRADPTINRPPRANQTIGPGPGHYTIPSSIHVPRKNRKNVMISTSKRYVPGDGENTEGPGHMDYDPIPLYGGMIKPSHNIMLSAAYARGE